MKSKLGDYIVELRDQKSWPTRELARRASVNYETLRKIELGETLDPGIGTVVKIAGALKINEQKLIAAFKGKDPDSVDDCAEDLKRSTLEFLQHIPKKLLVEAIIDVDGEEKFRELLAEAKRRNQEKKDG